MTPELRSTCLSPFCGLQVPYPEDRCPRCGRTMHDDADINRRGWHVIMLGMILAGVMGAVTWFTGPILLRAIAGAPGSTFTGAPLQAFLMLTAFIALVLTGGAFIVTSVMMIRGRSSRVTTIVAILLFLLSVVLIVASLLGGPRGPGHDGAMQGPLSPSPAPGTNRP